jgi:hypothetical protein
LYFGWGLPHSVFRRSTTLLVVLGEWLVLSKTPTPQGLVRPALPHLDDIFHIIFHIEDVS